LKGHEIPISSIIGYIGKYRVKVEGARFRVKKRIPESSSLRMQESEFVTKNDKYIKKIILCPEIVGFLLF
jgi:hypothetical protein